MIAGAACLGFLAFIVFIFWGVVSGGGTTGLGGWTGIRGSTMIIGPLNEVLEPFGFGRGSRSNTTI